MKTLYSELVGTFWRWYYKFCQTCRAEDWNDMYGFDCPKCKGNPVGKR